MGSGGALIITFFLKKQIWYDGKKNSLLTKCAVANHYSTFFNPEYKPASTSACHGPFQSYLDEPSVPGFRGFHQHQTKWQQSPSYTPAKTSHATVSIRVFLSRPVEVTSPSSWRASRSWIPKKIPNSNQIFTRGISSRLLLSFALFTKDLWSPLTYSTLVELRGPSLGVTSVWCCIATQEKGILLCWKK